MPRRALLSERRMRLDYSTQALAHTLGIPVAALTAWEDGRTTPTPEEQERAARALHLSPGEFATLLAPARTAPRGAGSYRSPEVEAALTAQELGRPHVPVIGAPFWNDPTVVQAVTHQDTPTLIRLIRARTPCSQDQIARMAGLSQPMVSQLESGRRGMNDLSRTRAAFAGLGAPPLVADLTGYTPP